jgi:hypothetical protein
VSDLKIHTFTFKENEVSRVFLPKLLGTVFHFTTSEGWERIQACGYVDPNRSGRYEATSVHSEESLGRHLGAVCLFDLRNKSEDILREDLILYDYFARRWESEPSYFLLLSSSGLSQVTTQNEVEPRWLDQKMYIPEIESWYAGKLPLDRLEAVYKVQIFMKPS